MRATKEHKPKQSRVLQMIKSNRIEYSQNTNNDKNCGIIKKLNAQKVIQSVRDGNFKSIYGSSGYITLAVDRAKLGHTYIIIETKKYVRMFHFKANTTNSLQKVSKLIAWEGSFEEIKVDKEKGKSYTPQKFVENHSMSFQELKVSGKKANEILRLCEAAISENEGFSLIFSNFGFRNNCFSKVYNILKQAGFQLTWSSYLYSFVSPRLSLWLGNGFYNTKDNRISSYSFR